MDFRLADDIHIVRTIHPLIEDMSKEELAVYVDLLDSCLRGGVDNRQQESHTFVYSPMRV